MLNYYNSSTKTPRKFKVQTVFSETLDHVFSMFLGILPNMVVVVVVVVVVASREADHSKARPAGMRTLGEALTSAREVCRDT